MCSDIDTLQWKVKWFKTSSFFFSFLTFDKLLRSEEKRYYVNVNILTSHKIKRVKKMVNKCVYSPKGNDENTQTYLKSKLTYEAKEPYFDA